MGPMCIATKGYGRFAMHMIWVSALCGGTGTSCLCLGVPTRAFSSVPAPSYKQHGVCRPAQMWTGVGVCFGPFAHLLRL